jgi:hypothetical protein
VLLYLVGGHLKQDTRDYLPLARIAAPYNKQGAQVSLEGGLVPDVVLDRTPCHY